MNMMAREAIRLEAPNKTQATRLVEVLDAFQPELRKQDGRWEVLIAPNRSATESLIRAFEAIGEWLVESKLSSCRFHFGDRTYTLLQPSDERPPDSAELLLERTIQLQTALETRLVIEQAKGILAERMWIDLDQAFQILRRAARSNGKSIHAIAHRVVSGRETPAEIASAARALAAE